MELSLPTRDYGNTIQLLFNANPQNNPKEITRLNNILTKSLQINQDEIDPVVHVAFDGRRILDQELVSAEPLIQVEITDENRLLPLNDVALFKVEIIDPDGNLTPVELQSSAVTFEHEFTNEVNKALLSWEPAFTIDGEYQLLVKGSDQSGNSAGRLLHEIRFEVQNKVQLSNLLPYPNPFTTSTRFVYTLTGSAPVDGVGIQIMTVSGRIVREITPAELGPLEVGTHQTDFTWDGTDEYGDQLANGVYLYRLMLPESMRAVDADAHYENSAVDRFFANDLGKIVILR